MTKINTTTYIWNPISKGFQPEVLGRKAKLLSFHGEGAQDLKKINIIVDPHLYAGLSTTMPLRAKYKRLAVNT